MPVRVAVLYGGRSGEHEISLRSAESIIQGLDRAKYEVQRIFITPEGHWQPRAISPEPGSAGITRAMPGSRCAAAAARAACALGATICSGPVEPGGT